MKRLLTVLAVWLLWWGPSHAGQEFSTENAAGLLRKLSVEIGPRPMGSPAEREALGFAAAKLLDYGCDTAYVMPMTQTKAVNTSSGVAIGIMKGKTGRIIILGGHIDTAGPEIPGANDDGSGTAVVLEAARVLSGKDLESTIVFALFGGEEQGLEGSEYFVNRFEPLDSVVLMLQVDMANGLGTLIMDPDAHGASAPGWLVRAAVAEFDALGYSGLIYPTHYFAVNYSAKSGSGSDHVPFLLAGIPAIDFTTDVGDPIHTQQDTYGNFDVAGLKRSGELVLRLVERFDRGTPDRTTERYWLYLFLGIPVMVPIPLVWVFVALAPALGLTVLLRLRRSHLALRATEGYSERKWTALKIWLIAALVSSLGWMSPDLIGLLKGLRYPWFAHPEYYYVPALLACLFGLLAGVRMAAWLKISVSPYVLFKRSFIVLTPLTFFTAWAGVEMAVEPAVCLALLSVALLMPWPLPAALAALAAPVWMFRLIFSEAAMLNFRFAAPQLPGSLAATIAVNAAWIFVLSLLVFAWLPGAAAVIRRRANPWTFIAAVKSRRLMVITAGLFGICCVLLLLVPSYERPWYPEVQIEQVDRTGTADDTLRIRGSDYLTGAEIRHGNVDTVMEAGTLRYTAAGALPGSPRWLDVEREITREAGDSTAAYEVLVRLRTPFRPYTVTVVYSSARGASPPITTSLRTQARDGGTRISWYSFPDTAMGVPVRFSVPAGDTLREEITVTFDSLMLPVEFRYREANVTRRCIVKETAFYPGAAGGDAPEGTR
ncbi:MAG TPA: M28 family metallopeptidase [Bacteroidota bacterium]|nr:M28 family metallopeptidase [Bacteroidota bacterium]